MALPGFEKKDDLIKEIGDYRPKQLRPEDKPVDYASMENALKNELTEETKSHLYEGVVEYQNSHEQKINEFKAKYPAFIPKAAVTNRANYFRECFIEYLNDKVLNKPNSTIDVQSVKDPEKAAIDMKDFFGEIGTALYEYALEEEAKSVEYMNALAINSTKEYEGKKWAERPIVIVAGPSASGKTHAANAAIREASKFLKIEKDKAAVGITPNKAIFVDGGIAREVSQIRKLASKVATHKGYSGIKDLHDISDKQLKAAKKKIYEYALATEHGIIIPETFSDFIENIKGESESRKMLKRVAAIPNSKLIFTRVKGKIPSIFRRVVFFMGNSRAWKTRDFKGEEFLSLNENNKTESKNYNWKAFYLGKWGSKRAEKWYKENCKTNLTMRITNDLVLMKPDTNNPKKWINALPEDEGTILVSARMYDRWLTNAYDKDGNWLNLDEFNRLKRDELPAIIHTSKEVKVKTAQAFVEECLQKEASKIFKLGSGTLSNSKAEKFRVLRLTHDALETVNLKDKDAVKATIEKLSNYLHLIDPKRTFRQAIYLSVQTLTILYADLMAHDGADLNDINEVLAHVGAPPLKSTVTMSVADKTKMDAKAKPAPKVTPKEKPPEIEKMKAEPEPITVITEEHKDEILDSINTMSQILNDDPELVKETPTDKLHQAYQFAKQHIDDREAAQTSFKKLENALQEKCRDSKTTAISKPGGIIKRMSKPSTIERRNTSDQEAAKFSYAFGEGRWSDSAYAKWAKEEIDTLLVQYHLEKEKEMEKGIVDTGEEFQLIIKGDVPRVVLEAWVTYCHIIGVTVEFGKDNRDKKIEPYSPTPAAIKAFEMHLNESSELVTEYAAKKEASLTAKKVVIETGREKLSNAINSILRLKPPVVKAVEKNDEPEKAEKKGFFLNGLFGKPKTAVNDTNLIPAPAPKVK